MFRRNFAKDESVVFPRPHPALTSGRVLTMDLLKGCRVIEDKKLDMLEVDRQEIAKRMATAFIQMIFRDGFYQADPHPGNFIVLRNGNIGLIDAGMVGRIDEQYRAQIEDILMAAGDQDTERLTDSVLRITGRPHHFDRKTLSADLSELFRDYGTQTIEEFNISALLNQVTDILYRHKLILPGRMSMLIKCLTLLEGTARLFNPTFSLAGLLAPWRSKLVSQRFSLKARFKKLSRMFVEWERLAESVPRVVLNAMDRLEDGQLAIRLEHRNLKSAVNRLIGGLFISSLLLSSTLLISRNVPPLAWSISIPGAFGYVVAIFFGVHLLWMYRDKANKDEE
jgi:ubiquinone biosynthesis protein